MKTNAPDAANAATNVDDQVKESSSIVDETQGSSDSQNVKIKQKFLGILQPGSTLLIHAPQLSDEAVMASLVAFFANGKDYGPCRVKHPLVVNVMCGTQGMKESAFLEIVGPTTEKPRVTSYCVKGSPQVSLALPEGLEIYRRARKKVDEEKSNPDVQIASLYVPKDASASFIVGAIRAVDSLRNAASASVLILTGQSATDIEQLGKFIDADNTLHLEACEPDEDSALAFKVTAKSMGEIWRDSGKKSKNGYMISMLNVPNADKSHWTNDVFLNVDAEARNLIRLRFQEEKSMEEIATILKIDKSTVKRRIDKLSSSSKFFIAPA